MTGTQVNLVLDQFQVNFQENDGTQVNLFLDPFQVNFQENHVVAALLLLLHYDSLYTLRALQTDVFRQIDELFKT